MEIHRGWIRYTKKRSADEPTFGSIAISKEKERADEKHNAKDQVAEELKGFSDQVFECVSNGKKHFDSDFFIEVLFCYDRIIPDLRKNIFAARVTCPTPFFDQAVYKYTANDEKLAFMWVVPDKDTCEQYRYHIGEVDSDKKEMYEYIIKYYNLDLAKIEFSENNKIKNNKIIIAGS